MQDKKSYCVNQHLEYRPTVYASRLSMADLLILALTVFTFKNNTKIAVNIGLHLFEFFPINLLPNVYRYHHHLY